MVYFFVVMDKNIFLVLLKRNLRFLYKKMVFFLLLRNLFVCKKMVLLKRNL